MKNLKFLILTLVIVLYSCERDDICTRTTPTTPALILEFFDITEIEELKSVIRLSAYGEILFLDENDVLIPPTEADTRSLVFNSGTGLTSLTLPLRLGIEGEEQITRYALERDTNRRLDTNTATDSNIDILEIKYIPELVYVSRACGFKSIFTNLSIAIINDGDNWIQSSLPLSTETITVENENQTHVQLFH